MNETCWFCGDPALREKEQTVSMHLELGKTYARSGAYTKTTTHYRTATLKIPICGKCRSVFPLIQVFTVIGVALGIILLAGAALVIANSISNPSARTWVALLGFIFGAFGGAWLGKRAGWAIGYKLFHAIRKVPAERSLNAFPDIKECLAEGYKFGGKPSPLD